MSRRDFHFIVSVVFVSGIACAPTSHFSTSKLFFLHHTTVDIMTSLFFVPSVRMMAIFCYKYFIFSCDGECSNTVWFTLQLPYDAFLVGPSKVGHVENQFRSMSVVYETRLLVVRVAVQIRWGQSRGLPASFYPQKP